MIEKEEILSLLSKEESSQKRGFWYLLAENDISITDALLSEGKSKVAIYEPERDAGYAEILIREMLMCAVDIDCIVTDETAGREISGKYGLECVSVGELSARKNIDFVVIVSSENYLRQRIIIRKMTSAEVISLKGLIDLVCYAKLQIPALLESKEYDIKSCLLGWPRVSDFDDEDLLDATEKIFFSTSEYQKNPERFKSLYSDLKEYSDDYIKEIFLERPIIKVEGSNRHTDCTGRFVNIINGMRMTADQPDDAEIGIYIWGGCMAYGIGTDDRRTISSFLQKHINNYYGSLKNSKCSVYNLGEWGADTNNLLGFMKRDKKKKKIGIRVFRADLEYPKGGNGRIYRYFEKNMKKNGFHYIDLTSTLYEIEKRAGAFIDMTHTNHRGYKAVADKVWNEFLKPIFESGALNDGNAPMDAVTSPGKWKMLRGTSRSVSEFFTDINARNAGIIYDAEKRDMLSDFAGELIEGGVAVTFIDEGDGPQDDHLKVSELSPDGKPDIVVLSTVENIAERKERTKKLLETEVIGLSDVIELLWDKYFFFPKISEALKDSEAYLCICFQPWITDLGLPASTEQSKAADGLADDLRDRNYTYLGANLYNEIPAYSKEYLNEITESRMDDSDGIKFKNADRKGIAVNVERGTRLTVGQPAGAKRRVHVFGGGAAFGIGAEDKYTLSSFLQEHMNTHSKNFNTEPIVVENEGVCLSGVSDIDILDEKISKKLRGGKIAAGDIVIWLIDKRYSITETDKASYAYLTACLEQHGIQVLDLTQAMRLAQKKLTYIDKKHVNQRGYKIAATKLYMDYVKRVLDGNIPIPDRHKNITPDVASGLTGDSADEGLTSEQNAEFRKYLEYLESERGGAHGNIGAIVMNCNPFTKGHRYLVERASSEVDFLYVFVVEEDKSFFPFADRFKLVSEGLGDIRNVRVLRSGKFIISTITFPGYFSKDSAKEVAVDTSLDLRLFGRYIVPALGIRTRFAGNEPTDMVTRQYNKAMKEILPHYGVRFVEFERIANGSTLISASTVRALLSKQDWDGIRNLVPDVTYKYLRGKFQSPVK